MVRDSRPVDARRPAKRALVIGLPPIERQQLRAALKREGFGSVIDAEGFADAAAILASELVEVVFTAAMGSGFDYRDVFELLRGRGPNRGAAVIVVGRAMAQAEIVSAVKAGVAGVVELPLNPAALREVLAGLDGNPTGSPRGRTRSGAAGG